MRLLLQKLWADNRGALIAVEWVFLATILILGILTGLIAVRQAVLSELTEFAQAILGLNNSFSFSATSNCLASQAGGGALDPSATIQEGSVGANEDATIEQEICD